MRTKGRLTTVAAIFAGALLIASCGAKTSELTYKVEAPGDATTTTASAPETTETTTATEEPTTTLATSTPETTAPAVASGDRSVEAFCAAAGKAMNSSLQNVQSFDLGDLKSADESKMMATFTEWMGRIDQVMTDMEATAPAEIADDMRTLADATHKSYEALRQTKDPSEILGSDPIMGGADSAKASMRVAEYTLKHCGFSLEGNARR